MRLSRSTVVALASFAALSMVVGTSATAQVPFLGAGLKKLAYQAAAKEIAPVVTQASPIDLDWNNLYPTVDKPPGGPFRVNRDPTRIREQHRYLVAQLAKNPAAPIPLRPGDYVFFMRAYCTHAGAQAMPAHPNEPWPENFELAPLNGRRASILPALYARAAENHVTYRDTQLMVWSITNGVSYDQMQPGQQALFNKLVPQYRTLMDGDPVQRIRDRWEAMRHKMPLLPTLDAAVDKMGAVGNTIRSLEQAQQATIANANNFEQSKATLAPQAIRPAAPPVKSWSKLSNTVYAKIVLPRNYHGIGSIVAVQVRVLPATAAVEERGRGSARDFDNMVAQATSGGGGFGGGAVGMPKDPGVQAVTLGPTSTGIGSCIKCGMDIINNIQGAPGSNNDPGNLGGPNGLGPGVGPLPPDVGPVWLINGTDPVEDTSGPYVYDWQGLHR
jgi:hypothetical protein